MAMCLTAMPTPAWDCVAPIAHRISTCTRIRLQIAMLQPQPTTQPSPEPTVKTTPVAPFDDFVCPNGGNELFPRPGHCTQFYLCEDGFPVKTYIFNCPHGSEFDPSKKQCVVGGHFDC